MGQRGNVVLPDACFAPPVMGADAKAFEDAAPFYMAQEWRHGIAERLARDYAKISPAWLIVIYEARNKRLGFRRGDLGQIEGVNNGQGMGKNMVYWPQDSFFWRSVTIPIKHRIKRAYCSLSDPPTKETYDRQRAHQRSSGLSRRDFEAALEMGLDAEAKVLAFLREQTGFGLWPLSQETIRVERHLPSGGETRL